MFPKYNQSSFCVFDVVDGFGVVVKFCGVAGVVDNQWIKSKVDNNVEN